MTDALDTSFGVSMSRPAFCLVVVEHGIADLLHQLTVAQFNREQAVILF
jgi:hypothetical protein